MLRRRTIIAAKIETVYGTDSVPTADNVILAYDVNFAPGIESLTRRPFNILGELSPQPGARTGAVSFSTDIYGSGTAGSVPAVDPLLRAAAFSVTTEAAVQNLYEPVDPTSSTDLESVTIYVWQDGLKHVLTGCRGKVSIDVSMGQRGKMDWSFEAKEFTWTDEDPLEGEYSLIVPPVCLNCNFSIEEYAAVLPSVKIDVNNEITRAPNVNATGGYQRVDIVGREIVGSMSPEAVKVATHPYYTKWAAGTKSSIMMTIGSTAGNIIKIFAPRTYFTGASFEDRGGILAHSLPFKCAEMSATVSGVVDSATASSITDTSLFNVADEYNAGRLNMTSGTYSGKSRLITNETAAGVASLEAAYGGSPTALDTFTISKRALSILFK